MLKRSSEQAKLVSVSLPLQTPVALRGPQLSARDLPTLTSPSASP